MSGAGRVAIDGARSGGLEREAAARLAELDLVSLILPPSGMAAERHAILRGCGMLVSLYPAGADALLCIGLATGMGLPVLVLSSTADDATLPRNVRLFTTLQALVDAAPPGPEGRHVDEPLLKRLGACPEGLDWYLRRYPGGRRSSEWTLDEQIAAFADGGARWLKTAFDHGLIRQHAMAGADFAGVDLAGLRLTGTVLSAARLPDAKLAEADLVDVKLAGSDLSRVDLTRASLIRSDLQSVQAPDAVMAQATIERTTLDGLVAPRLSLAGARLAVSSLQDASLPGASLFGASLRDVDLRGADLSDVDARGAFFDHCRLTASTLRTADFTGAVLNCCTIEGLGDGETAPAAAHIQPPHLLAVSIGKNSPLN